MSDKTCSACQWARKSNTAKIQYAMNVMGEVDIKTADHVVTRCHIRAPSANGFPIVKPGDWCGEWQASDKAKSEPAQVNPGDTVTFHNLPESAATNDSFVFSVFTVPHDPPKLHSVKMSAAELTASLDQFTHKPGNMMPGVFDRLRGEGVLPAKTAADQGAKGGEA